MEQLKQKISSEIYESLVSANIRSLSKIVACTKTELAQITRLDLNSVEELFKKCVNIVLCGKIATVNNLSKWQRISTGCTSIDSVIKGGIPLNGITEFVGCSGVGKTQLCLQLALMTQMPSAYGGLEKSVVYICTEDVFPIKRLIQLAEAFRSKYECQSKNFEDNVFIEHVADAEQLKRCLFHRLPKFLTVKSVGLVVIDSIAGVFRSENLDVKYSTRSQDFISVAAKLNKLSGIYGFATVCTNQVTDNIATAKTEPCLGLAWSNLVTHRFAISRYSHNQVRELEVNFAPDLPNAICKFVITREGIAGVHM